MLISLARSSVDKITDEQAENITQNFRAVLEYVETGKR